MIWTRFDKNILQIKRFSENTDTPVYVMLAPTAAGIYSAKLPAYTSNTDQREMIDNIYYDLDSRIDTIDTFFPMYSARNTTTFTIVQIESGLPFGVFCLCRRVQRAGF